MKKAAFYMRLSKADRKAAQESRSIQNQRKILRKAIEHDREFAAYDIAEYIDDGYSGMDERRPALSCLIDAIQKEEIAAVFVKDMSRLSRNSYFMAKFREQLCVRYCVTFVSVGEGYDTRFDDIEDTAVRLRALFHEYYSKDISYKVKRALEAKKENGEYAVARPPFGYRASSKEQWEIHLQEAASVKRIFEAALLGVSQKEIAKREENRGVVMYPVKVHRILYNPVYCGYFVWHKNSTTEYIPKRNIQLSPQQWRVQKGNHEPVIDEETFRKVQKRLQRNRKYYP